MIIGGFTAQELPKEKSAKVTGKLEQFQKNRSHTWPSRSEV